MLGGRLEVRSVDVEAGGTRILEGIDLALHPGELCALIGPSGAGKSTLMKVLLGLRRPNRGEASLGGGPVGAAGPVGYVPQDDALHRDLPVRRELDYAARLRLPDEPEEERSRRVEGAMAAVGLTERADVRIKRLSGGQRKRVSVALELLTRPHLLILDEPTSGLDPGMEAKLMGLFAEIASGGRIVLVATHAMESLHRCDALAIIMKGRLIYFGPPAEAAGHFGAGRFAEIFPRLEQHTADEWRGRFQANPLRDSFRRRPPPAAGKPPPPRPRAGDAQGGARAEEAPPPPATDGAGGPPAEAKSDDAAAAATSTPNEGFDPQAALEALRQRMAEKDEGGG